MLLELYLDVELGFKLLSECGNRAGSYSPEDIDDCSDTQSTVLVCF